MRHHPLIGLDYIIDILLVYRKYEGRKMTVTVRRHAYVRNTYTHMVFREDTLNTSIYVDVPDRYRFLNRNENSESNNNDVNFNGVKIENNKNPGVVRRWIDALLPNFPNNQNNENNSLQSKDSNSVNMENIDLKNLNLARVQSDTPNEYFFIEKSLYHKTINFVLPLTGRWEIFQRFLLNYEKVCLEHDGNTNLVIVLFENEFNNYQTMLDETISPNKMRQSQFIQILLNNLKNKYSIVNDKSLKLITSNLNFSRSIGCELGAALFNTNELIFFVDVDIMFTNEFLLRARLNTIEYKQVYYPIVFSEYDPDDPLNAIKVIKIHLFIFFKLKEKLGF
jgi:hypothetical protein